MAKILLSSFVVLLAVCSMVHSRNVLGSKGVKTGEGSRQFIEINGSEYYIDTNSWLDFEAANQDCTNRGSRLVTFSNQEKYDELMAWVKRNQLQWQWFWSGGYRAAGSNDWKWATTEQKITNFMWAPARPSDQVSSQQRCITFNYDFKGWDDDNCTQYVLPHICEKC